MIWVVEGILLELWLLWQWLEMSRKNYEICFSGEKKIFGSMCGTHDNDEDGSGDGFIVVFIIYHSVW